MERDWLREGQWALRSRLCEDPLLGGSVALPGSSKPVPAEVRWSRLPLPQPRCSPSGLRMAAKELEKGSPFGVWSSVTHHPHANSQSQGLFYLWVTQLPCFGAHSLFLPVSCSSLCSLTGSESRLRGKQGHHPQISIRFGLCFKFASWEFCTLISRAGSVISPFS